MKPVVVENVGRKFSTRSGEMWALKGVSLEAEEGEIFGLLGPNGAGKTTLLRILATLLLPTYGRAYILGKDVVSQPQDIHPFINLLSGGETGGYGMLSAYDNLWFFAMIYGLSSREAKRKIEELSGEIGISHRLSTRFNKLSSGERQKINLVRALLNNPRVLFLDEPTLGLDVESARNVRKFIKNWVRQTGSTVIWTTHYMHEAEEMCDKIAIIKGGKIIAAGTPGQIKSGVKRRYRARVVAELNGNRKTYEFYISTPRQLAEFAERLIAGGAKILDIDREEVTLEEAFVELVFEADKAGTGEGSDKG